MTKIQILLVEDDDSLGQLLQDYLGMKGFQVTLAADGEAGLRAVGKKGFDLCILDVMMPKMDGYTLAGEIKAVYPAMPLIFLTARSLKIDVLKGFHLGADDYIKKPVDEEELVARIHAVLARTQAKTPLKDDVITLGNFRFDPQNQKLIFGEEVQTLTKKETRLLHILCNNQGQLTERDEILREVWGKSDYFNRKSMDVFISHLRKYLLADPRVKITNVHGSGFVLEVEE